MSIITTIKTKKLIDHSKKSRVLSDTVQQQFGHKSELLEKLKNIDAPDIKFTPVHFGDYINYVDLNNWLEQSTEDIDTLDKALDSINTEIAKAKQEFSAKIDMIQLGINKLNSLMDTLALYSGFKFGNIAGVTESFRSLDDIIVDSSKSSLFVNTQGAELTLPLTDIQQLDLSNAKIIITDLSDGLFDSEHKINKAFDNSDISYTDYYQEAGADDLTLQFTVKLPAASIINNISILPNIFDLQNISELSNIELSIDGITFESILRDPINLDKEFNTIFIPRNTLFIRYTLKQYHKNINDNKFHIALAEIKVRSIKFSESGSIKFKKAIPSFLIKTMALHLDGTQNNDLFDIKAQISVDGEQWYPILPVSSDQSKDEILYFNQPWMPSNLGELKASDFIYLSLTIKKLFDIDNIKKFLGTPIGTITEFNQFPTSSPFTITLENTAIKDSVEIIGLLNLATGSAGKNTILMGSTKPDVFEYTFDIPIDTGNLEDVFIGPYKLVKYDSLNELIETQSRGYFINNLNHKIHIYLQKSFGEVIKNRYTDDWLEPLKNTDPLTIIDANDRADDIKLMQELPITLVLHSDRKAAQNSNVFKLSTFSNGIIDNVIIDKLELDDNGNLITENISDLIPAKTSTLTLSRMPLDSFDISIPGGYQVKFIDGNKEFTNHDARYAYSIDFAKQILHLRNQYLQDVTINYTTYRRQRLSSADFKFGDTYDQIVIQPWAFNNNSAYEFNYHLAIPVDKSQYNLLADGKTIQFTTSAIIQQFMGINNISDKNLKISYRNKELETSLLTTLFQYISPIISKLSIIFSKG